MYHIKEDKRAHTSASMISKALLQLLQEKEFNRISITDIQRTSYVGRATFYRLFDNLSDVMAYLCDQTLDRILAHHRELAGQKTEEVFLFFIEQWMQNEMLLQAIFDSNHFDILYKSFRDRTEESGHYFFPNLSVEPVQADYIVSIAATAMVGGLSAWIQHGKTESAKEVFHLLKGSVNTFYQMIHLT